MASKTSDSIIAVADFRRQSMVLDWNIADGSWTACELPPPLLRGVAYIRPSESNICLYGQSGTLYLQVGTARHALSGHIDRVTLTQTGATFGFRRRFVIGSTAHGPLYSNTYWPSQGEEFFRWLTEHARDVGWCERCAQAWSTGVDTRALRAG